MKIGGKFLNVSGVVLLVAALFLGISGCFGAEEELESCDEANEGLSGSDSQFECTEEEGDAPLTFATIYDLDLFSECGDCHAPGADGFVDGVETTQDWTDMDSAYAGLQGTASGLIGNFSGCNGVPFIGDTPETSLLVAVLDETVRDEFSLPNFPDCNGDAIADMTLKLSMDVDEDELQMLKDWISAGAEE